MEGFPVTDIATTQTLASSALTPTWDHRAARAERLSARNAALDQHRRELGRKEGPRWLLGLSLVAIGGAP